jgi:hypothetical protein
MSTYRGPSPEKLAQKLAHERAEVERFPALLRRASLAAVGKRLVLCAVLGATVMFDLVALSWLARTISPLAPYPAIVLLMLVKARAFVRLAGWLGDRTLVELLTLRRDSSGTWSVSAPEDHRRVRDVEGHDVRAEEPLTQEGVVDELLEDDARSARKV